MPNLGDWWYAVAAGIVFVAMSVVWFHAIFISKDKRESK